MGVTTSPSDRFPPTSPATRLGFFRSEQILPIQAPIYAAMLILNGLWVWEARMSEWGEWWADVKVMIWWMAISVVSGELLALAMREIGF